MDAALLAFLQQTTTIFLASARYYITSSSKTATKARELASKITRESDPFHAAIYARLHALQSALIDASLTESNQQWDEASRQLLQTFEDLIDPKPGTDFPPPDHPEYAGLSHLQRLYDADGKIKRRPKPLGYRKYLFNPSIEIRTRLKNQINVCCNALSSNGLEQSDSAILSDLETIQEWKVPASMLRQASRIRDVLLRHWECPCVTKHDNVKLAFSSSPKAVHHQSVTGYYELYWPMENGAVSAYDNLALHLLELESKPDHIKQESSRRVAFALDEDNGNLDPARRIQISRSICEAVTSASGNRIVEVNETLVRAISHDDVSSNIAAKPQILSLDVLLVRDAESSVPSLRPKDRIIIAVALAYTYLHLCDTAWWPNRDIRPEFWFVSDSKQNAVRPVQPLLRFSSDKPSGSKMSTEMYINPSRPNLPAFGKLLLEIWKGSRLNWGEELDAAVAECELDPLGEYWLCAVNACLGAENVLKEKGALLDSVRMRSVFVLKVVKSLQWLLEKCVRLPVDVIFSQAERPLEKHSRDQMRPRSSALGLVSDTNKLCLHDGSRTWELLEDKGNEIADAWFARLRQEVHPLIRPQADPVRVAIIDTGALFDKKTRAMYGRRIKEIRSWVGQSATSDGICCPVGEDMDGHGTHATSVFLEVDPFSEVYVAKVFESRDEKEGAEVQQEHAQRVATAIDYAVKAWKVKAISLSFGFERQIPVIRDAISAAEHLDVVILAAASNCGGNARLGWPSRHPTVLSIYATDGFGNKYARNPTQQSYADNFATLGSNVKGWWPSGQKVMRSGTSTATPVATGIASIAMHFMAQHRNEYCASHGMPPDQFDDLLQRSSTFAGMRSIFRLMVERDVANRDGYGYVAPWRLLNGSRHPLTIVDSILAELEQA